MKIEDIMTMKNKPDKIKVYTEKEVNLIVNKTIALCKKQRGEQKNAQVKKELKLWIDDKFIDLPYDCKDNKFFNILLRIDESL